MPTAVSDRASLCLAAPGLWHFERWSSTGVRAGVIDRHGDLELLHQHLPKSTRFVEAEQVHGSSLAIVDRRQESSRMIPGSDALITHQSGVALVIRSADCLPLFAADPVRRVIGLAHVGWRGLVAQLPERLIATMRHSAHSRPEELDVAIGPSIRSCCYEVGPEFVTRFGPFVQARAGRLVCDLIGAMKDQLRQTGVHPERIVDSGQCTSCEGERWFSLRREGPATGRNLSFIVLT